MIWCNTSNFFDKVKELVYRLESKLNFCLQSPDVLCLVVPVISQECEVLPLTIFNITELVFRIVLVPELTPNWSTDPQIIDWLVL